MPQGNHYPILVTCHVGNLEILQLLIAYGAEVNAKMLGRETALKAATEFGHIELVKFLLENGAEVNPKNFQESALYLVCRPEPVYLDIARLLLSHGAIIYEQAGYRRKPLLVEACRYADLVRLLLESGASVNVKETNGETALHAACFYGNLDSVKALVEHGAEINITSNTGLTPLHEACRQRKNPGVVAFLLEKKANINAKTEQGETPITLAAFNTSFEAVKLLVENGADVQSVPFSDGYTPEIYNYLRQHNWKVVQFKLVDMVRHKMFTNINWAAPQDLNAVDESGLSALYYAFKYGRPDIAKQLLQRGASVCIFENEGEKINL